MDRLQAEMENSNSGIWPSKRFTMVVFPEPEGAEKISSFPFIIFFVEKCA
jgi:hypothetical protein